MKKIIFAILAVCTLGCSDDDIDAQPGEDQATRTGMMMPPPWANTVSPSTDTPQSPGQVGPNQVVQSRLTRQRMSILNARRSPQRRHTVVRPTMNLILLEVIQSIPVRPMIAQVCPTAALSLTWAALSSVVHPMPSQAPTPKTRSLVARWVVHLTCKIWVVCSMMRRREACPCAS